CNQRDERSARLRTSRGVSFSFEDPTKYVTKFAEMMPNASPSMRLDHLAKQKSEIDSINGMVPVLGEKHGIQTPFNQTIVGVVRAAEIKFMKIK
ncbi:MAG: ketopantoate reductase C-terminal domain-containing protein, partial [Paracoccaceae bacterium]